MSSPSFYDYESPGETNVQYLNLSEEEEIRVKGLSRWLPKLLLYHLVSIILLGIPYLLASWYPKIKLLQYNKSNLRKADSVLLQNNFGDYKYVTIEIDLLNLPHTGRISLRSFLYKHSKFVWLPHLEAFGDLNLLFPSQTTEDLLEDTSGLSENFYDDLLKLYGPNQIEIEVKSYWKLFVEEVFNPFYLFQAFAVVLWIFDEYLIYAGCVLFLTLFSIITALLQTRKQSADLKKMVETSDTSNVHVVRNSYDEEMQKEVTSADLVPGDLIVIPKADFILPCDAVLLTGQCIVNESMLTGESVPITKTSLQASPDPFSISDHKRHILFSGTRMIQSRYYGGERVLARVVKTGYNTTKGALVKSILFPTPIGFQFYQDSLKFIFVLFCIATAGMAYSLHLYIKRKAPLKQIVIRSLDIVTIVVPPALPAAMTIGISYSQERLKKLGIFCISPQRINVSGKVNLACFDKTGTLTNDGLDMHSVLPCVDSEFTEAIYESHSLDEHSRLIQGMATCHSLTQIDGSLNGDPLDLSMFAFTGWELEEPGDDETARFDLLAPSVVKPGRKNLDEAQSVDTHLEHPYQLGIIRQFPFSSNVQCMSVICRGLSSQTMLAFTKGAPEKVSGMCQRESLPPSFSIRLKQYAVQGFRVIALAYKEMPKNFKWKDSQKAKRDVVECNLTFLGLFIMQNTLKPETTPVMMTLRSANIRTVMITGDNILTAISVARDCAMLTPQDQIYILETKDLDEDSSSIPQIVLQNIDSPTGEGDVGDGAIIMDSTRPCHFAMDGKTWSKLRLFYTDLLPLILVRTTVFARFQPDQKTQVIKSFQNLDYLVSMVGDGANDCGALKAAHVGVSLSQAEASVAAPFTSSIQDISCIVKIILEGRCALVTSFAVFKYMALYSLIQFFTVIMLSMHSSLMGDSEFLYIDLILTTTLAVTMGLQGPSKILGKVRPMASLVSLRNLIPLILQILICCAIQESALLFLIQQKWYEPVPFDIEEPIVLCWENTVLFTVANFQYIILSFVYSKGRPYRQMLISNFWYLISALGLAIFSVYLMIYPSKEVAEFFEVMYLPKWAHQQQTFMYKLLILPLSHFFISVFIEVGMADRNWFRYLLKFFKCRTKKKKYKDLLQDDNEFQYFLSLNSSDNSI